MRAASALLPTPGAMRSHECEHGTQECVRHGLLRSFCQQSLFPPRPSYKDVNAIFAARCWAATRPR